MVHRDTVLTLTAGTGIARAPLNCSCDSVGQKTLLWQTALERSPCSPLPPPGRVDAKERSPAARLTLLPSGASCSPVCAACPAPTTSRCSPLCSLWGAAVAPTMGARRGDQTAESLGLGLTLRGVAAAVEWARCRVPSWTLRAWRSRWVCLGLASARGAPLSGVGGPRGSCRDSKVISR